MIQGKTTKQGVRDLNPKPVNGRPTSCSHFRNPETATRVVERVMDVEVYTKDGMAMGKLPKLVGVHVCVLCGEDRYSEHVEV